MWIFIGLTIVNVILQTIKSLCTIRCDKLTASLVNCVAYGVYTYVIFYTTAGGLPLWGKALITAAANFIGVYGATTLFDKVFAKDVLWKVEVTVPPDVSDQLVTNLKQNSLSYIDLGANVYEVFCPTQKESAVLRALLPTGTKYNVTECAKRL